MANVVAARALNWQRAATDHFNQRRCPRLHRQVHQTVGTRRLVDCHQDFLGPNAPASLLVIVLDGFLDKQGTEHIRSIVTGVVDD